MPRITEIDALRGIAIILMVIYHFFFDLNYFGISSVDLGSLGFVILQRVTAFLFLFIVGVSLVLSEKNNKQGYKRHAIRAAKLGAIAAVITIATFIYPHDGFIKFGIIHLIALSTLIAPFFFRFGSFNAVLGLIIIAAGWTVHYTDVDYLFWLGLIAPDYTALDHYPLVPWFGIVLLGISAGRYAEKFRVKSDRLKELALLGRNSLLIYLVHQPVLVVLMLLIK